MKKYIILILISLLAFACDNEEKDFFDDSAANRISAAVKEYDRILKSSPKGWKMEFYAGSEVKNQGGYNYFCQFNEQNEVEMSADSLLLEYIYGAAETKDELFVKEKSSFKVISEQGPVLVFNTYNELFHPMSEPQDGDDTLGGDYEFIIMEGDENRIELKGKKWGKRVLLTRLSETTIWEAELQKISDVINSSLTYLQFDVLSGARKVAGANFFISNFNFIDDSGASLFSEDVIYTQTGIKFYSPITFDGKTVQHFDWDAATKKYISKEESGAIILQGLKNPGYLLYDELPGAYSFEYTGNTNEVAIRNATLETRGDGKTYLLKDAFASRIVIASYDKRRGGIEINPQRLGPIPFLAPLAVHIISWSTPYGSLTTNPRSGGVYAWDGVSNPKKLNFYDSGMWSYPVDGFLMWIMSDLTGESFGESFLGESRYSKMSLTKK